MVRFPCLEQAPADYSGKISHHFICHILRFQCAKIVTDRENFYLTNLLSKRWCQKSLSETIQHVGLLLIGFSLPQVR